MKSSWLLAPAGLCLFTYACSGGDNGGSLGGAGDAGAAPSGGSGTVAAAGQAGNAGSAAVPSGGMSAGGFGGNPAGGAAGNAGDGSLPSGGGAQAGSGGAGQAGGAASGTGLDPALPPGKNFDLTHFVLQLPVASGSSVQQISDLATYTSQYFYTAADGAMTFWCPVTGAHTPNTHYPRTELRELATGGDWAISGTHTLTATFKVTQTPPSKGTIIGQIHGNATGGTAEILKLEWTTQNTIVASVEDDNNPATQIDKTIGSYTLGEQISYAIKLQNSLLQVTITDANGVSKSVSSPYTASSWTNDKYYFKLGDYVQLNTGTNADGGLVSFYAFAIQHG
jgi:hypothetical protein